mgnify:CR=1 FL=1
MHLNVHQLMVFQDELVQGIIAGGYPAIFKAQEGAEDSKEKGKEDLIQKKLIKMIWSSD